jgi:hypothetical protein
MEEYADSDAAMYSDLKSGSVLVFVNGGPTYLMCELAKFDLAGLKGALESDLDRAEPKPATKTTSNKPSPKKGPRGLGPLLMRSYSDEGSASSEGSAKKHVGAIASTLQGIRLAFSPRPKARPVLTEVDSIKDDM